MESWLSGLDKRDFWKVGVGDAWTHSITLSRQRKALSDAINRVKAHSFFKGSRHWLIATPLLIFHDCNHFKIQSKLDLCPKWSDRSSHFTSFSWLFVHWKCRYSLTSLHYQGNFDLYILFSLDFGMQRTILIRRPPAQWMMSCSVISLSCANPNLRYFVFFFLLIFIKFFFFFFVWISIWDSTSNLNGLFSWSLFYNCLLFDWFRSKLYKYHDDLCVWHNK